MIDLKVLRAIATEEKRNIDTCLKALGVLDSDWKIAATHADMLESLDYCYKNFVQDCERSLDLSDITPLGWVRGDLYFALNPYSTLHKDGRRYFGSESDAQVLARSVSRLLGQLIAEIDASV